MNTSTVCAYLAVFALASCGGASEESILRSQREYDLAVGLYGEQDTAGAFEHLLEAIELDPDNADAHLLLGNLFMINRQDSQQAEHHMREAIRANEAVEARTGLPSEARNALGVLYNNAQRYEEAALTRDRANAFANAVTRQRLMDQLRAAGDVEVRLHDTILHVRHGVLVDACDEGQLPTGLELPAPDAPPYPAPLPRDAADEVLCLARALEKASFHARLLSCTGEWAQPAAPVPEITRLDILPALAA